MMSREPDYYAILGVEPTADDEAITAAYNGRSLRYRVGQLRNRAEDSSAPSQEALEQAYSILGNPQSRAIYDKIYYPDKPQQTTRRRRVPAWLWAFITVWLVAIVAVGCIGIRTRVTPDQGAISRIVQTTTVGAVAGSAGGTATIPPPSARPTTGSGASSTVPAALSPTVGATAIASGAATAAATTAVPATVTAAPTGTTAATVGPTQTATALPTATVAPTPTLTAPPPTPTPEPPPPAAVEPTPEPTEAPPAFQPTDRIGTALSVNLRAGPGAGYGSLGLLPTGTQLAATGQSQYSGGQLWRRFALRDGRVGWIRDLDVFTLH